MGGWGWGDDDYNVVSNFSKSLPLFIVKRCMSLQTCMAMLISALVAKKIKALRAVISISEFEMIKMRGTWIVTWTLHYRTVDDRGKQ